MLSQSYTSITSSPDLMAIYKKWHLGFGATYQSSVQNIDGAFLVLVPLSLYQANGKLSKHAQSYFDHLVLMNTRLVACGKTSDVFTDQILTDTYGGKLTTIAKSSQELENKEFPIRHQ